MSLFGLAFEFFDRDFEKVDTRSAVYPTKRIQSIFVIDIVWEKRWQCLKLFFCVWNYLFISFFFIYCMVVQKKCCSPPVITDTTCYKRVTLSVNVTMGDEFEAITLRISIFWYSKCNDILYEIFSFSQNVCKNYNVHYFV